MYNTVGVYNVTLTVTDKDGGQGAATATVTVTRLRRAVRTTSPQTRDLGQVRFPTITGWATCKRMSMAICTTPTTVLGEHSRI